MYSMYTFSELFSFHYHTLSHSQLCLVSPYLKTPSGTWVAQLGKYPTSAQVTISQSVSLSPASVSVLVVQSLEPALDSVSPSLSAHPPLMLCLCLSKIKNKNVKNK